MNSLEHAKQVLEEQRKREHNRAPEETLCGNAHNNRDESCLECEVIKANI